MTEFIQNARGFPDIQALLDHLSIWIDGWAKGAVSSDLAVDYLDSFVDIGYNHCTVSPDKTLDALLRHQRRHEADRILGRVHDTLVEPFHLGNLTIPVIGMPGSQNMFEAADLDTLKPGHQLTPKAVAAVLATLDLPTSVMVAPPLSYYCHQNGRNCVYGQAVPIDTETTTILCPLYFLPHRG